MPKVTTTTNNTSTLETYINSENTVPAQNAIANVLDRDVIGNKTDTIAGNSLVSEIKKTEALHPVPAQNAVTNTNMRDVIGNKLDDEDGTSVYSKLYKVDTHVHGSQKVYPTLANGVVVAGAADAWTLGNFVQIVPVNTITSPFDIHYINISNASAADTYELVLYAATTEIGRLRMTRASGVQQVNPVPFMTPIQPANTQIQAKVASSSGGADELTISIFYHLY